MDEPFLTVCDLEKSFPTRNGNKATRVLDHISLEVCKGEFVTIFGPNGCGKSTLLNILAGLTVPDRGTVKIGTKDPKDILTGFIFQDYRQSLLPWRKVHDNIGLYYYLRGERKCSVRERVISFCEELGLNIPLDVYPYELSGGQQQLAAIARALIYHPDLMVMDEPLSALDLRTRLEIQQAILRMWTHLKITTLFVSHDIDEAILLADRLVILTQRPARVFKTIKVNLARPRVSEMLETSEFQSVRGDAIAAFMEVIH